MDPSLPWYKSAIIRQQIVQLIVAGLALFGIATDIDWSATVEAVFAGVAAAVAVWTVFTRLFKPAPNLTATAAAKEQELVAKGTLPKQGGFARIGSLLVLAFSGALALFVLQGCAGTQAAYRAASDLPDTAYVVTEHYAAVLKEAADLAALPGTPANVVAALQKADQAVKPLIIGDPATGLPGLRQLTETYQAVRDAKTEADLQIAINAAVRELSNFIKAVKAARGST